MDEPIYSDDFIRAVAAVCHEANRAFCMTIGEFQVPWNQAPEWQTRSAIEGVKLHLYNPDAGPEASHLCWSEHKLREGWVHGAEKDPVKKTHPCLVSWDELGPEQRMKDRLFQAIVRAFADGSQG